MSDVLRISRSLALSCLGISTVALGCGSGDGGTPGSDAAMNADGGSTSSEGGVDSGVPVDGGSDPSVPTPEAQALYDLINAYRAEHALPAIPLSPSLTFVAVAHVQDLIENGGSVLSGSCNLHSWSDQGVWSACCYTSDHAQASCMWDKPSELTVYTGNGYEISAGGGGNISAQGALDGWKSSAAHNDVILNQGIWTQAWGAIGVAIDGSFAHVWFGHQADPAAP